MFTFPAQQAHALAKVAGALAVAGEARSAARVAAALCAVGTGPTEVALRPGSRVGIAKATEGPAPTTARHEAEKAAREAPG